VKSSRPAQSSLQSNPKQEAFMTAAPSPVRVIPFSHGLKTMQISRTTAYKLMRDPTSDFLKPFRIGSRLLYLEGDVAAWLQRQASAAQMAPPALPEPDGLSAPR
jgi:predicted DNA-binding transcriptional regulator AlpA